MESSSYTLNVDNLSVAFGSGMEKVHAVSDISFSLEKGETVGIVGESGSGKSVTALSIMHLIQSPGKVTGGEIFFRNKEDVCVDLLLLPADEMRKYRGKEIAMIFQEPMTSLNPVFTSGYQVSEAIRLHFGVSRREAKERSLELFHQVKDTLLRGNIQ